MNIAMLLSTPLPPREGIGFYCANLARELVRGGHSVTLITRGRRTLETEAHDDGYTIVRAPFFPVYPFHVHLHGALLRRTIEGLETKTDVFHLHSPLVPTPLTPRPLVATIHTPMKADTRALERPGLRTVLGRAQALVSVRLEQALLARANVVTTVSRSVKEELAEYDVAMDKVHVVPNGTDTTFFTPTEFAERQAMTVLYSGRLALRKGLFDLLEAMRTVRERFPQARLLLAGSGQLEHELRNRSEQYGMRDHVRFLGHVSERSVIREAYRQCAVYAQPSHYEGLPTSLLEAMSCATPCVATSVSGHLDVIEPGRNGILVPHSAANELAGAIGTVLEDPLRAKRLGEEARDTVVRGFTWPALTRRFLELYEAAIACG